MYLNYKCFIIKFTYNFFQQMLKAEIICRLWLTTYGFHDYHPDPKAWPSFEKFLVEWCAENFVSFLHPGIRVTEKEVETTEDRHVAGIFVLILIYRYNFPKKSF